MEIDRIYPSPKGLLALALMPALTHDDQEVVRTATDDYVAELTRLHREYHEAVHVADTNLRARTAVAEDAYLRRLRLPHPVGRPSARSSHR